MPELSRLRAWARWQAAAGPWRGWVVCPSLTMPVPAPAPERVVRRATGAAPRMDVGALERMLHLGGTAVVLDLEPVLAVRTAAELSRRRLAYVVLVVPRWPHSNAVLRVDELIAVLVRSARDLDQPRIDANVVFVLDADRQRSLRRPAVDARVDNRYSLTAGDLPNLATLRAAGIRRVIKVARRARGSA